MIKVKINRDYLKKEIIVEELLRISKSFDGVIFGAIIGYVMFVFGAMFIVQNSLQFWTYNIISHIVMGTILFLVIVKHSVLNQTKKQFLEEKK